MNDSDDGEKQKQHYLNVVIPMLRQITPTALAQQIVGVQPMSTDGSSEMELGETLNMDGTVEFYWVKPSQGPSENIFSLRFNRLTAAAENRRQRNLDILEWCFQTYGPRGIWGVDIDNPNGTRWCASDQKYYFRNESDRTMFMLRWE